MPVATARTITLIGAAGHLIDVQVDVAQGMVATALVGRPDASVTEARDRCRNAVSNAGYEWPATRRVTVLLSPSDLPKRGPHFDLAIAIGVLAASGQVPGDALERTVMIGELTLDGRLRPVPGLLPMTLAASARGIDRVFVPESQVREAAMVPGMSVFGVRSLAQVAAELRGVEVPEAPPVPPLSSGSLLSWRGEDRLSDLDLADLVGLADAKYAAEVAAAGGHHLLLTGPPGSGKTSLAERLPGILPDLTVEESLELTAIHSLAGVLDTSDGLISRPPFFAPHHTSSRTSLLGGGTGKVRPGELSRAHCGVLLLDEFPLFASDILEALRQPLEAGEVTIARGEETATYPARGMFVMACNPCPCGGYSSVLLDNTCVCKEVSRRDYQLRLSGPITDRLDITRHVRPVGQVEASDPFDRRESSADVRRRVTLARERQADRYAGLPWRLNAHVPTAVLREEWPLSPEADQLLDAEMYSGRLSRRGATRVHRVAWSVADLRGLVEPGADELAIALRLRRGDPLDLSVVEPRCVS
ncbi:ATP-binding protein [Nocardioides guangzhouensis]|uniref:ATP-binding protein n=1 Tax=Nocardioides guangzhouensis TaxID=2497878 RepID=A0A4Q4ZBC2_9ACTN|nr:YifB family Mg chelatase-like AAA ATPase [Nocardioides guangzhouensis]RYP84591.1 ATP-binding protein [Nocardioides guangzhouensis]